METPFLTALGLIKVDVVDSTSGQDLLRHCVLFCDHSGRECQQRLRWISFLIVSVGELEPSNSVSEELDLATLANAWHNVEAGCRQYKRITTLPTRHPPVYDTVYLYFNASDNLTTDNITLSY